jgi:hypothetical protein
MSLAEVQNLLDQNRAITLFQYNALLNAIPQTWINWIRGDNTQMEMENHISEANYFYAKPKQIKEYLLKRRNCTPLTPHAVEFWNRKLNFQLNEQVWLMPRQATKEVRLRELQWKLLHNIYPTNILLEKTGVCYSKLCDYCPGKVDLIEHFFFECTSVRQFWTYIENLIFTMAGKRLYLTVSDALFGHNVTNISASNLWINRIILLGKMCISKIKKTKSLMPYIIVFEQEARLRKVI